MLNDGVYEGLASPEDLAAIDTAVEVGRVEVSDDRGAKLADLGYVNGDGTITAVGHSVYEDMLRQRQEILDGLNAGRILAAADRRDHTGGKQGKVPLVKFEDADVDKDEGIFIRAVADWLCRRGELERDPTANSYVTTRETGG